MNSHSYQSPDYPNLSSFLDIKSSDFVKLRKIMRERGELDKFTKWLTNKYIRINDASFLLEETVNFNNSKYVR